jgi:GST-like protein
VIDLYTWTTPNGRKVSIMLEECGLDYAVHPINISAGEQSEPEYVAINPNGKIPALVDKGGANGPVTVFESGAILVYLAEKTGKFLPTSEPARSRVMSWLMFQMAGIGPMFGQAFHFAVVAEEKLPYAIKRYRDEGLRLLKVLDDALADNEFLAGELSIADFSTYPWVSAAAMVFGDDADQFTHVLRWLDIMDERPATQRGMAIPKIEN